MCVCIYIISRAKGEKIFLFAALRAYKRRCAAENRERYPSAISHGFPSRRVSPSRRPSGFPSHRTRSRVAVRASVTRRSLSRIERTACPARAESRETRGLARRPRTPGGWGERRRAAECGRAAACNLAGVAERAKERRVFRGSDRLPRSRLDQPSPIGHTADLVISIATEHRIA